MSTQNTSLTVTFPDLLWEKLIESVRDAVRTELAASLSQEKENALYSFDEIAAKFSVSKPTLHQMCRKGLIHRYYPDGMNLPRLKFKEVYDAFKQRRPYQKIKID